MIYIIQYCVPFNNIVFLFKPFLIQYYKNINIIINNSFAFYWKAIPLS